LQWQTHDEHGAAEFGGFDADAAAMSFGDFLTIARPRPKPPVARWRL